VVEVDATQSSPIGSVSIAISSDVCNTAIPRV